MRVLSIPEVSQEAILAFTRLWRGRGRPVVVFTLDEINNIVVLDEKEYPTSLLELAQALPEQEVRWIAIRCKYGLVSGSLRDKVVLILWTPVQIHLDKSRGVMRPKSSGLLAQEALLGAFNYSGVRLEVGRPQDMTPVEILEKLTVGESEEVVDGSFMLD